MFPSTTIRCALDPCRICGVGEAQESVLDAEVTAATVDSNGKGSGNGNTLMESQDEESESMRLERQLGVKDGAEKLSMGSTI